jgi:hypothetical protein
VPWKSEPVVENPDSVTQWTCSAGQSKYETHHIVRGKCALCGKSAPALHSEQWDILHNIFFEAVPIEGDLWVGHFRYENSGDQYCGHKHKSADAADQCAGQQARWRAKHR